MEKREKRKDQEVPLVIFKSGEQIEIGHIVLKGDGSIVGQIAKDVKKEISDLLFNGLGSISLNPKVAVTPNMMYHNAIKQAHPNIQEQ